MKHVLSTFGRIAVIFVLLSQAFASPLLANAQESNSTVTSPLREPGAPAPVEPGTLPLGFRYARTFGVPGQPYPSTGQNAYLNQPMGLIIEGTTLYATEGAGGNRLWQFNTGSTPGTPITPWAPYGVAGVHGTMDGTDTVVTSPYDVWKDPTSNYMWVANWYWNNSWVTIFDTSTGLPLASFHDFANPSGIPLDLSTSLGCVAGIFADPTASPFRLFVTKSCGQTAVLVFAIEHPYDNATRTVTLQSVIQGSLSNPRQVMLTDLGAGPKLYVTHRNGLAVFAETSPNTWTLSGPSYGGQDLRGLGLNPTLGGSIYATSNSNQGPVVYRCYYPDALHFNCDIYIQGGRDSSSGWVQVLNDPQDIAFDAGGNAYVSDSTRMTIEKFTAPDGLPVVFYGTRFTPYTTPAAPTPPPDSKYYYFTPSGVAVDANYNLYIFESSGHRLTKLDPSGAFLKSFGVAGVTNVWGTPDHLNGEGTPAIDAAGRIYIPDSDRVMILDNDLNYLDAIRNPADENYRFSCPRGIAIGPNGDIFVVNSCAHNIQVYTADRIFRSRIGVKYEWGADNNHFNQPGAVAVLDTDTILVADGSNNRIQKCVRSYGSPDPATLATVNAFSDSWSCTTFAGTTGNNKADNYSFVRPYSIAWDATHRRVFVGDKDAGTVKVLDETGKLLTQFGETSSDNGGKYQDRFFNLLSVAVDGSGNLYVADSNHQRVQKYIPALAEVELAGQIGGPVERVVKDGDYLYAKVGARLGVFSLADPAQPALYGQSDLLSGPISSGPVIRNGQAYAVTSDGALRVFSLADRTHLVQTGLLPMLNDPRGLAVQGNWAFVSTCCSNTPSGPAPRLSAIDVSNPAAPKLVASYDMAMFANVDKYIQRIEAFAPASGPIQVYMAARNRGMGQVTFDPTQLPANPGLAFGNPKQFSDNGYFTEFVVKPDGTTLYALDTGKTGKGHLHAIQTSDMLTQSQYNINTNIWWISLDGSHLYLNDDQVLNIYDTASLETAPQSVNATDTGRLARIVPVGNRIYSAAGELGLFTRDYTLGTPNTFTLRGQFNAPAGTPGFLEGIGSTIYDFSGKAGLRIINAANPAQMQETVSPGNLLINYATVEQISNRTYAFLELAGPSPSCSLAVADVTDPLNVTILANSSKDGVTNGVFDCGAGRMRSMPGAPNHEQVFVLGANPTATGSDLLVFDVNLGGNPVHISNLSKATLFGNKDHPITWGALYTQSGATYLLAAEQNTGLRVINVTNPSAPVAVGIYPGDPNGVEVLNGKAYVSDFKRGLVVLDLANIAAPATLTVLGSYWFQDWPGWIWSGYLRVKAFGTKVYVYIPNGDQGLRVMDATDPTQIRQVNVTGAQGGSGFTGYVDGSLFYESVSGAGIYAYWAPPVTEATLTSSSQTLDSSAVDGVTYHLNGATPPAVTLLHMPVFSGNTPPAHAGMQAIGHAYAAFARNPANDQPVTTLSGGATYHVSVRYTDAEVRTVIESSLAFYAWDGSQWVKDASSTVDLETNTVSANPNHFSLWTVLGPTDTTSPEGTIVINAGAAFTFKPQVTLTLAASDATSPDGIQMLVSNTNSCATGTWQPLQTSLSWTLLPGLGKRTVSVCYRDLAGNVSAVFSDDIGLNTPTYIPSIRR